MGELKTLNLKKIKKANFCSFLFLIFLYKCKFQLCIYWSMSILDIDMYNPSVSVAARQGAGFAIGSSTVGGLKMSNWF